MTSTMASAWRSSGDQPAQPPAEPQPAELLVCGQSQDSSGDQHPQPPAKLLVCGRQSKDSSGDQQPQQPSLAKPQPAQPQTAKLLVCVCGRQSQHSSGDQRPQQPSPAQPQPAKLLICVCSRQLQDSSTSCHKPDTDTIIITSPQLDNNSGKPATITLQSENMDCCKNSLTTDKPVNIISCQSENMDCCINSDKPASINLKLENNKINDKPAMVSLQSDKRRYNTITLQSENIDCSNNRKHNNKPAAAISQSDNKSKLKEKRATINRQSDNDKADMTSHQSDDNCSLKGKGAINLNHQSDNNKSNDRSATINNQSDNSRHNNKPTMINRQSDNIDCCGNSRPGEKRARRRKTSFTEALKEKYCVEDDPTFDFIIVSPKRKTNSSAELAHLQTVVLNDMGITRADIPRQGLVSLCPNVVDLDLANNLLETWSELLSILSHLPKVRYLNVSRNRLNLDLENASESLQNRKLSVENLALNDTGTTIEEVVALSQLMPTLKELHLCDNNYEDLDSIEERIINGALSCLECLRLNNNEITRWSEVWKLRDLPHLKCLVLSGNPISNVFYHSVDRTNNNVEAAHLYSLAECHTAVEVIQKTSVSGRSDADINVAREKCLHCELAGSNMDVNCGCGNILIDNFDQGDDGVTDETFDDVDNIRPVSRLGFHSESSMSVGSCGSQNNVSESDCDNFILTNPSDRIGKVKNMHTGVSDSNINNSCQGNIQKCLCEGFDMFDGGFFHNDEVFENGNMEGGENTEPDDWHRTVAEEFLHEIIDGIPFDDFSDERVPQFQPASCDQTLTASDSIVDVGSSPDSISDVNITCKIESSTSKQSSAERTSFEARVFESDLATSAQEMGFSLDYSPMSSDIDAQFIPRAVRLFDDDIKNSFFYMATPSPPRSRVQRCLFQEPVCNDNSQSDETEDVSYRDGNQQSASDSCSDCEAEQFKHEKQMTNVGADVRISSTCAEVKCTAPGTSSQSKLEGGTVYNSLSHIAAPESSVSFLTTDSLPVTECSSQPITLSLPDEPIRESSQLLASASDNRSCHDGQNLGSNNNNNVSEHSEHNHHCDLSCPHITNEPRPAPFQNLQVLCLSSANLHHWNHLTAFTAFPKLTNLRLKNNPLYSNVGPDDRRKLYIASLPKVNVLNGSEVSHTEREKAERHFLRYFMDKEDKPDCYHTLVKKHGPPVKLVDIDLSAGYQEWANLKFVCKGVEVFSRKIHLVDPVCKLRILISQAMRLPRSCFVMYHFSCGPSHPESERELVELRCESLPMSRFDFADGDEIHIDFQD